MSPCSFHITPSILTLCHWHSTPCCTGSRALLLHFWYLLDSDPQVLRLPSLNIAHPSGVAPPLRSPFAVFDPQVKQYHLFNYIHYLHMVNPWGKAWRLAPHFLLCSLFPPIITNAESSSFPLSCKSFHANWHLRATRCTALLGTLLKADLDACYISISAQDCLYVIYTPSREVFANWFIPTSDMK